MQRFSIVSFCGTHAASPEPSAIPHPNPRHQPTAETHWIYIGNPNKQTHKKLQNALKITYNIYKNKHTTRTLCQTKNTKKTQTKNRTEIRQ